MFCYQTRWLRGQCIRRQMVPCIVLLFLLAGCQSPFHPRVQQLLGDLSREGITLTPTTPFIGTNSGLYPVDQEPVALMGYQRDTSVFLIHVAPTVEHAEQLEERLELYATEEYGLRGLDLPGSLRYYRCEEVIIIHLIVLNSESDPFIQQALESTCGLEFARYPLE